MGETIQDGIKNAVARRTLKDIVISDRQQITGEFMKDASEKLLKLGILLVDVRMQRIALQEEVASSVYDSMKRTFEGIAQTQRGEGSREAQIVKSEAERRRTEIIATSLADAQRIRGEGDRHFPAQARRDHCGHPSSEALIPDRTAATVRDRHQEAATVGIHRTIRTP